MIHVYPVNDWIEHDINSTMCICEPKIDWNLGVVVHNSADGRELKENDKPIPYIGS